MGVMPGSDFTRVEVVRVGWLHYRLVAYTDADLSWGWNIGPGAYFTRKSAEWAGRRLLRRQRRPPTVSTVWDDD